MGVKPGTMDGLRDQVVQVLDALRRDALRAGLSPLKQYDQIATRMQVSARTAETVGEWATDMQRRLQIASPSNSLSSEVLSLQAAIKVASDDGPSVADVTSELLDVVVREHGYFIARLRQEAQRRKDTFAELRAAGGDDK